jgi:hypothetical protein
MGCPGEDALTAPKPAASRERVDAYGETGVQRHARLRGMCTMVFSSLDL